MTNPLLQAIGELKKEDLKKKKKPILSFPKEKRLQYYSGWHKDKPVTREKGEKQKKLH